MSEPICNAPWTLRLSAGLLILTATVAVTPQAAWSQAQPQTLPPTLRACLAEPDRDRRLDCFDRESARLIMPPDRYAAAVAPPAPAMIPPAAASPAGAVPRVAVSPLLFLLLLLPRLPDLPLQPISPPVWHVSSMVVTWSWSIWTMVRPGNRPISGSTDLSMRTGDTIKIDRELGRLVVDRPLRRDLAGAAGK